MAKKKSIIQKFRDFVEASSPQSNEPMTGTEIATARTRKRTKGAAAKRATAKAAKKNAKKAAKKSSKKAKKKSKR